MISLWCTRNSSGARDLVNKINELGGQAERSGRDGKQPAPGSFVVNWGNLRPPRVHLNQYLMPNKLVELEMLAQGGARTPEFRLTRPGPPPTWLPRTLHHHEAKDLLGELEHGDYYTKYVPCVAEGRVHVFQGQVIRVGTKVPRTPNPHPWVRSWDAGWKFSYDHGLPEPARALGRRAVRALGYDFGAVDIGVDERGEPLVFEVNSAPGLEGHSLDVYAEALMGAERRR